MYEKTLKWYQIWKQTNPMAWSLNYRRRSWIHADGEGCSNTLKIHFLKAFIHIKLPMLIPWPLNYRRRSWINASWWRRPEVLKSIYLRAFFSKWVGQANQITLFHRRRPWIHASRWGWWRPGQHDQPEFHHGSRTRQYAPSSVQRQHVPGTPHPNDPCHARQWGLGHRTTATVSVYKCIKTHKMSYQNQSWRLGFLTTAPVSVIKIQGSGLLAIDQIFIWL